MKRQDFPGRGAPLADVLPPEFDADIISSFFEEGEPGPKRALNHANQRSTAELTELATPLTREMGPPEEQTGLADGLEGGADQAPETDNRPDVPNAADRAIEALRAADERATADLASLARPLNDAEVETETETDHSDHDHGEQIIDDAAAKPIWAGGKDDTGTGGKGNGRGKNKDKNDTGETDSGTDTGTGTGGTDSGTDTGGTDGGTDTGGTDTGGTDGGTETNPGSNSENVYVSGMDNPDGYNVELLFEGSWTDQQKQYLANAAEMISDIITEDLPNHNGIDDIQLTIVKTDIDGSGGAWATGGPRSVRSDSYLPSTGTVRFDTADVDNLDSKGLWEDLGLHEMLHAMGFGTLFDNLGLAETIGGQERLTGQNAIQAYNDVYSDIAGADPYSDQGVQLDQSGAHWHDGTFTKEIMTPYLRLSGNYLSDMSIAALEDIGYSTVYGDNIDIV